MALRPLRRADAEIILSRTAHPITQVDRLLHARALLQLQSYELARGELSALATELASGSFRARALCDLIHIAYYLGGRDAVPRLFEAARSEGDRHAAIIADVYLGVSLCAIADNDVRRAVDAGRCAEDAVRAIEDDGSAHLLAGRIQRQMAHVLAQSADYAGASEAAAAASHAAAGRNDSWEMARNQYTAAFVSWHRGARDEADGLLTELEARLRPERTALWRWVLVCLARVRAEMGAHDEALRLAQESGFDAPEEYAFLALARGEVAVARRILTTGRPASPAETPFRKAVEGILLVREGRPGKAMPPLHEAEAEFEAVGLLHYAFGCRIHRAFALNLLHGGVGDRLGRTVWNQIRERSGEGFAWYDAGVGQWLDAVMDRDTASSRQFDRSDPDRADGFVRIRHYHDLGLTWREIEILGLIEQSHERMPREELARSLGISRNTLRIHLWHIRQKLDVTRRGDAALREALNHARGEPVRRLR